MPSVSFPVTAVIVVPPLIVVCACVLGMIVFVFVRAWPIFEHNGLSWLGPGGNLETQIANMQATSVNPPASAYRLNAWPLVYGTLLTTGIAIVLGIVVSVLSSIFIVELAPARLRRLAIPMIRLLASVSRAAASFRSCF